MRRLPLAVPAALVACAVTAPAAQAERFAAVDSSNRLYTFDSAKPAAWKRAAITGLAMGERVVALDVRPANRQLHAVTNQSRIYVVSRSKATATVVGGAPLSPALDGSSFGIDFNPTVDRIRLVSNSGQNLRLNPSTGAVAMTDKPLSYKAGDPGAGAAPAILGSAYTSNVAGAMMTTLYGIDTARDALVIQAPPNDGVLTSVGGLGVNLAGPLGFDISAKDGRAYVLARRAGAPRSRLFSLNLGTGAAKQIGVVSRAPSLVALAALSKPAG